MTRIRRLSAAAVVLVVAGCSTGTPLDPAVGEIVSTRHVDDYEDCGYENRYDPYTGEYRYMYGRDHVDDEYTFHIRWESRRFKQDDGTITTIPARTESGFQVDETTWHDCDRGDFFRVDNDSWMSVASGECNESREALGYTP